METKVRPHSNPWAATGALKGCDFSAGFYGFCDDHNLDAPSFFPQGCAVENVIDWSQFRGASRSEIERVVVGGIVPRGIA